ncbi:hypothetical protein JQX09_24430 [Sulfitobacter pseudonitzschiae]|uniref:hypothetical protein n=1 Tax=Pseudosulfitobacter pseudonitzschiae TaxID=1402135 RepID=UPI001AF4B000|nr:hypothetical protein [Pseudosulfitobacter pseudonitzschiae]MBM2295117.1 hypothetical protein [Pseudosulfitobacter pseudonitzschiae]MBM2300025.1 hypothetical protein [Pseudosulfitobacter pseudonitzschiae]MBM2304950.1 hypothetical protein [Pseudosulfitobacter pseudonitzschiae]MBM2314728.1 hypothetical protein [Pseudosulfitobacter pseudonitzschiae]MBM2319589.1 hypothetical protein [Pseudosulfitobacter pseudonitzschiae]
MSIETRLRKLEGPTMGEEGHKLDFIFIVGIKSTDTAGNSGDPTTPANIRPSTDEPQNFIAYCLHPHCEAREHSSLPGETVDQMAARLRAQHLEAGA